VTTAPVVRWGFIGAGFVASRALAPAVHAADSAVLQVVGSSDERRAASLEPRRTVGSYDAVCAADDVDVVYVSLRNSDHLRWVVAALEAGKHVLCEKPLGLTAREVGLMTHAARRADRLLVEATWNHWHPRTRRAQQLVSESAEPRDVQTRFTFAGVPSDNYRLDPASGGGALLDVGPYLVGAALWALGTSAVQVHDVTRHVGPTGVDLTTAAVLAAGDSRARIEASIEQPESQVLRVEAPDLTVELVDPAFTSWREPSFLRVIEAGAAREEAFAPCDAYRLMVDSVSAAASGQPTWVLPLSVTADVAVVLDDIARAAPTT